METLYFCKITLHFLIPFSALEQQITKNECLKKTIICLLKTFSIKSASGFYSYFS
ncbi:hypothetical protein LEP1GSC035_3368 [Leptospira noguchii str. 2007001578]|uniref:Uncharacterized protein n=1 Tax=Leptospira noguchii str. 2007001578 TaxID=1049974 RepID=A0ABP2TCB9_9LEPT|nr:hypothetical protein LEP1GSC035_3368 [Leptospira noguchii str. 2007001578]